MRTAFDLDLNIDLVLFAGPIPGENLALVVYEGQVAVGGADMLVPPAVTPRVLRRTWRWGPLSSMRAQWAGTAWSPTSWFWPRWTSSTSRPGRSFGPAWASFTEVGVLATLHDENVEAEEIVPGCSADSTVLALCHLPLQQVQPGRKIPLLPWAGRGAR